MPTSRCAIIDYGMGNLRSIQHKLERLGVAAAVVSNPQELEDADVIILPGVGHFGTAMQNLNGSGLRAVLEHKVIIEKTPILGICLGVQLFAQFSEEGDVPGLGWIRATVKRFNFGDAHSGCRIPHIAWNTIQPTRASSLLTAVAPEQRFYFIHSYHLCCADDRDVVATTRYGYEFPSVIHHQNIWGTQFHPEKSHMDGMRLIENFIQIAASNE